MTKKRKPRGIHGTLQALYGPGGPFEEEAERIRHEAFGTAENFARFQAHMREVGLGDTPLARISYERFCETRGKKPSEVFPAAYARLKGSLH